MPPGVLNIKSKEMTQEVKVTVEFTLDVDAELDKEAIREDVERLIRTVFIRNLTPLRGWLSAYAGLHVLLDTAGAKVTDVKEEAEIYGNS